MRGVGGVRNGEVGAFVGALACIFQQVAGDGNGVGILWIVHCQRP